jgi:hypothetical protein
MYSNQSGYALLEMARTLHRDTANVIALNEDLCLQISSTRQYLKICTVLSEADNQSPADTARVTI